MQRLDEPTLTAPQGETQPGAGGADHDAADHMHAEKHGGEKDDRGSRQPHRPEHGHRAENPKHRHHGHELLVILGAGAHERGCHGLILKQVLTVDDRGEACGESDRS